MSEMNMKELKQHVRELRKEHCPPVSKLKKEALKKEYEHLSSLHLKSPNVTKEEVVAEAKKMPKVIRLVRPVEAKEVKEEVKTGRKPSAYAEFVKQHMKPGMSMKEVAELYKKTKK